MTQKERRVKNSIYVSKIKDKLEKYNIPYKITNYDENNGYDQNELREMYKFIDFIGYTYRKERIDNWVNLLKSLNMKFVVRINDKLGGYKYSIEFKENDIMRRSKPYDIISDLENCYFGFMEGRIFELQKMNNLI